MDQATEKKVESVKKGDGVVKTSLSLVIIMTNEI